MSAQTDITDVTTHLREVKYPADRDALLRCARESGAPAGVLETLGHVEDRVYGGVAEVSQSLERVLGASGEQGRVDEASEESFPASDPPSSMSSARHIGKPPADDR